MKKITVLAPAKINLFLDVCARRADGYHDIESVMQTVTLFDRVEIASYDDATGAEIAVSCSVSAVPSGEGNIVYRAAKAFFAHVNIPVYRVDFSIDKKIHDIYILLMYARLDLLQIKVIFLCKIFV